MICLSLRLMRDSLNLSVTGVLPKCVCIGFACSSLDTIICHTCPSVTPSMSTNAYIVLPKPQPRVHQDNLSSLQPKATQPNTFLSTWTSEPPKLTLHAGGDIKHLKSPAGSFLTFPIPILSLPFLICALLFSKSFFSRILSKC